MCGIAALLDHPGAALAADIAAMTQVVRHRGPDDEGYALFSGAHLDPMTLGGYDTPPAVWNSALAYAPRSQPATVPARIALGHRRLSIVDLSAAGHQPMCTPDGRYWIVYNGEVYNHIELRTELAGHGYRFVSGSDTEVILAAWQHWGKSSLERLNGMFAFVLVDRSQGRITAVRDRFGVKPLYWWQGRDGCVGFASEIKQFTVLPGWTARVNGQRAYDYLVWSVFDHTDETLFADVRQLRGGELLEIALGAPQAACRPERWYTLRPRPFAGSAAEAADLFRTTFTDAVRLRLRSDVPVGSCLSGGLDSSSIVCVANRLLRDAGASEAHATFSAGSRVPRYDERRYAEAVIAATGVEAHFIYPEPDAALDALEQVTWHQDEPFGSSSIYAQWCVFAAAAGQGVKVMLDGQGADEQLAGYPGFLGPRLRTLLLSMRLLAFAHEIYAAGRHPAFGYRYTAQQLGNTLLPDALRQRLRSYGGRPATNPAWLDVERLGALDREPFADERSAIGSVTGLSRRLLLDTGVPMLLHTEDRNSMAHSVESRVPFLDYRLVELVLGMPDHYKLARGVTKRVLRDAMRGTLPEMVRTRADKLGFATAEETWVKTSARERFRASLRECIEATRGIVRHSALEDFDAVADGRRRFDFGTWRLVNFGVWLRRFDVRLTRSGKESERLVDAQS